MKLLIVSQRAIGTNSFNLKDLTGHGRMDVIIRCLLASNRHLDLTDDEILPTYCYLKGDKDNEGWIEWKNKISNQDEISLAFELKTNWPQFFKKGSLNALVQYINPKSTYLLAELGSAISKIPSNERSESLFVLGAQLDLSDEDLSIISPYEPISLSNQPMLASHAIIKLRQVHFLDLRNSS